MLTVDYDRLGLQAGDLLLDLGAGNGRHAFEALRLGARVIAYDYDRNELVDALGLMTAMDGAGERPTGSVGAAVNGDAVRLPFPDATFDRIIAAEVLGGAGG
jgi:ubiquinone/menaquinone biosynthesis C-methylase UbiE